MAYRYDTSAPALTLALTSIDLLASTALDNAYDVQHGPKADAIQLAPFESMLKRAATRLLKDRPELQRGSVKTGPGGVDERLVDAEGRLVLPPGGLQSMSEYHLCLVRGGAGNGKKSRRRMRAVEPRDALH